MNQPKKSRRSSPGRQVGARPLAGAGPREGRLGPQGNRCEGPDCPRAAVGQRAAECAAGARDGCERHNGEGQEDRDRQAQLLGPSGGSEQALAGRRRRCLRQPPFPARRLVGGEWRVVSLVPQARVCPRRSVKWWDVRGSFHFGKGPTRRTWGQRSIRQFWRRRLSGR